jgi:hypothetical protein
VVRRPEPPDFNMQVRVPGRAFLKRGRAPSAQDFKDHNYWRRCLSDLHRSYEGICAYSCHWIPFDTGSRTVEHFKPKEMYPHLAYEWSNYRLVCGTLNGRKGFNTDVLDPFRVRSGWFVLKFPSLLVTPARGLRPMVATRVQRTIDRLRLNDDETCVQARLTYVREYRDQNISWDHLRRHAPFIAFELERQGLVHTLPLVMF